MNRVLETEVLIVGAGTTGLGIARELSQYQVDATVVEKNMDVCLGGVKASWGTVYPGIGLSSADSLFLKSSMTPDLPISELFEPDALKIRLAVEGFHAFPEIVKELDIPFMLDKKVILGKDDEDLKALAIVEEICKKMEVEPKRLNQEAIQALEPHISKDITHGLSVDDEVGFIYPWEYGFAMAENAQDNGGRIWLQAEVLGIRSLDGGFMVETSRGKIRTRFIVNAAGLYGDKIARMAGVCDFGFDFFCNMVLVTDRNIGHLLNREVYFVSFPGRPRGLIPTYSGNILIGCSGFHPVPELVDTSSPTRQEWIEESMINCKTLVPEIRERDIITTYSGVYQMNTKDPEDHLLEVADGSPHFINAIARMPSLATTPAMAKYIVGLLADQGLELTEKTEFNPFRKGIPKLSQLSDEERNKLIDRDPRYGRIVCRCEEVSEGEIVEAIQRGARTVSGVKYRTRAGMGRCQRNTCGPKILEILSRELGIPEEEITYRGIGSPMLAS